jgi:5-methylcytosine-specific restriction endonuclease McrA
MNTAREFTNRLVDLLRNERHALAELILALSEFDRRELWKELGYPSLFAFLQRELGLSDGAAYYRMKAARLVRDFPEIVEPLRDGRLCVTNVVELSKVITHENRREVLPRYFGVSKREAEAITVSIMPKPTVPTRSVVTAVRAPGLAIDRPQKMLRAAKGDGIPAHVKRAVWARDGGCCQWRLESGGVCGSTYQLEFDHREARALGGPPTIDNVRILCRFPDVSPRAWAVSRARSIG